MTASAAVLDEGVMIVECERMCVCFASGKWKGKPLRSADPFPLRLFDGKKKCVFDERSMEGMTVQQRSDAVGVE